MTPEDEELWALMQQFEAVFGEGAPLMQLPSEPAQAAARLREAIEARDITLIDRDLPPGALV